MPADRAWPHLRTAAGTECRRLGSVRQSDGDGPRLIVFALAAPRDATSERRARWRWELSKTACKDCGRVPDSLWTSRQVSLETLRGPSRRQGALNCRRELRCFPVAEPPRLGHGS